MLRIHLVRHGRAAASWAENLDPGLDQLGRSQALQAASVNGSLKLTPFDLIPAVQN